MPGPGTNQGHRAEFTNETSTLLVASKEVVQLGDPIEVSLIVKNEGERELTVDKNSTAFACFDVTDEEGQPVPYVGFMGQVSVNSVTLQPSSTDALVERLDLTDKYLFQRPGRYAIGFRGSPSFPSFSDRISPIAGTPPSNTILVDIRPGQLGELDQIVARLLPVCPKGWAIMKSGRGLDETTPFGRGRVRGYSAPIYRSFMGGEAVYLWLTKTEAPITSEQASGTSQYLGHTRGLHVYVSLAPKAGSVWPDALEDISRALQLEDGKVGAGAAQPARRTSGAATGAETASADSQTGFLAKPPKHGLAFLIEACLPERHLATNDLSALKTALASRAAKLGLLAYWETVSPARARVLVASRDGEGVQPAADALFRSGELEFFLVHQNSPELVANGSVPPGFKTMPLEEVRDGRRMIEQLVVKEQSESGLKGSVVQSAAGGRDSLGRPDIEFTLKAEAAAAFAKLTRENVGRRLAIVVDGKVLSAPVIRAPITVGSGQLTGDFTAPEAEHLASALESPLPIPVKVLESKPF